MEKNLLQEEEEEPISLEQRIAQERDEIWERGQKDPRWAEVCGMPEMKHFFTIQPRWFVKWNRIVYEIPQEIADTIESDYKRNKTSVDVHANDHYRFGPGSIDFTVGKFGSITLLPLNTHNLKGGWGNKGYPLPGTYTLDRETRDVSGKYFEAVIMYFKALLCYLTKDHQLRDKELEDPSKDRGEQSTVGKEPQEPPKTRGELALEVRECKDICHDAFRNLHLNYASLLLNYKFTSCRQERAFFEFVYRATRKMLRHFFNCEGRVERLPINSLKVRTAIEDVFNKMFRSNSFRFDYKRQQADWEALAEYLHQSDWGEDDKAEGGEDDDQTLAGVSPRRAESVYSGTSPRSRRTVTASTGDFVERKFTQLVCPPTRISLSRAMQNRSMLITCRYPDIKTTIDLLAERQHRPGMAPPPVKRKKRRVKRPIDESQDASSLSPDAHIASMGSGPTTTSANASAPYNPYDVSGGFLSSDGHGLTTNLSSSSTVPPGSSTGGGTGRSRHSSKGNATKQSSAADRVSFSAIPSSVTPPLRSTAGSKPMFATSMSSAGAAHKYVKKRKHSDSPLVRQRKVENRLMPHNQMDDITIPHDVLGEMFKDAQQLW